MMSFEIRSRIVSTIFYSGARVRLLAISIALSLLSTNIWAQSTIEIKLRGPIVTSHSQLILLKHIAEISGGTTQQRKQIENLDIDEFTNRDEPVAIRPATVAYRIQLAGFSRSQFRVSGATAYVQFAESIDVIRSIQNQIQQQISQQFGLPTNTAEVAINQDLQTIIQREKLEPSSMTIRVELPTDLPMGQQRLLVHFSDSLGHAFQTNVSAKILLYRDLVMAKENIAAGEILTESNVTKVRRPVESNNVRFASFEQTIGKAARSPIQQFSMVKSQAVAPPAQKVEYVMQLNSLATIHIRKGNLKIILKNARARQRGKIGETIEFINPNSRKSVYAKIVDGSTAIVGM